ncbi:zinc-binding dehydrogenase [Ammoniphilus sp. 3BR4]|uniref:zinc-binding dehydrogenase n=1 Tax=Ammoniphilus sp. 3BR4 TaxID=3158265 RepID=UPI003465A9BA
MKTEALRAIPDATVLEHLMKHMKQGELKAIITEVLPFEEKALQAANAKIEARHGRGKMVVQIKEELD